MNERTGCIYCVSTTCPKGVEHVVPEAIGLFEQNWTLECVCDACDKYFGETTDLALGRDSAEGLLRVTTGVRPAATIESFRNRTVTFSLESPGPLEGAHVRMRADGDHIVPTPTAQVGFRSNGGDWEYVLERDLTEERVAQFSGPHVELKILGIEANGELVRLTEKLRGLGIEFTEQYRLMNQPMSPEGGPFSVVHMFNIADVHRRAAAKVCFNYLAKVMGAVFARRLEFDVIRRFIRYGEGRFLARWAYLVLSSDNVWGEHGQARGRRATSVGCASGARRWAVAPSGCRFPILRQPAGVESQLHTSS